MGETMNKQKEESFGEEGDQSKQEENRWSKEREREGMFMFRRRRRVYCLHSSSSSSFPCREITQTTEKETEFFFTFFYFVLFLILSEWSRERETKQGICRVNDNLVITLIRESTIFFEYRFLLFFGVTPSAHPLTRTSTSFDHFLLS